MASRSRGAVALWPFLTLQIVLLPPAPADSQEGRSCPGHSEAGEKIRKAYVAAASLSPGEEAVQELEKKAEEAERRSREEGQDEEKPCTKEQIQPLKAQLDEARSVQEAPQLDGSRQAKQAYTEKILSVAQDLRTSETEARQAVKVYLALKKPPAGKDSEHDITDEEAKAAEAALATNNKGLAVGAKKIGKFKGAGFGQKAIEKMAGEAVMTPLKGSPGGIASASGGIGSKKPEEAAPSVNQGTKIPDGFKGRVFSAAPPPATVSPPSPSQMPSRLTTVSGAANDVSSGRPKSEESYYTTYHKRTADEYADSGVNHIIESDKPGTPWYKQAYHTAAAGGNALMEGYHRAAYGDPTTLKRGAAGAVLGATAAATGGTSLVGAGFAVAGTVSAASKIEDFQKDPTLMQGGSIALDVGAGAVARGAKYLPKVGATISESRFVKPVINAVSESKVGTAVIETAGKAKTLVAGAVDAAVDSRVAKTIVATSKAAAEKAGEYGGKLVQAAEGVFGKEAVDAGVKTTQAAVHGGKHYLEHKAEHDAGHQIGHGVLHVADGAAGGHEEQPAVPPSALAIPANPPSR